MTIKNILDFYYTTIAVIKLRIELDGGIEGRYHTFNHAEALDFIRGYENQKVIFADFETCIFFKGQSVRAREIPVLSIKYTAGE